MHKSALLRYFETREEIFLRLTADGWREWSAALRTELEGLAAPAPAAVADAFAGTLAARGLFCDLLAQAPLNLERNVSLETVRSFKLVTLTEVDAIVAVVRRLLPGLTERDGVRPHRGRHRDGRRVLADGDARARGRGPLPQRPSAGTRGSRRRAARRAAAHGHAGGDAPLVRGVPWRWQDRGRAARRVRRSGRRLRPPRSAGRSPGVAGGFVASLIRPAARPQRPRPASARASSQAPPISTSGTVSDAYPTG